MKALLCAIAITLGAGGVLFFLLSHIGADKTVSSTIAGSALAFFTIVHDSVSKGFSKENASVVTPGIVPISRYGVNPWLMLLYATMTIIGCTELASGVAASALLVVGQSVNATQFIGFTGVLTIPAVTAAMYFVGRWTGIRTAKAGYWITPIAFLVGRVLENGMSYSFLAAYRPAQKMMLKPPYLYGALALLAFLIGVGLLGVWRGNRIRSGVYFNSLLRQVSASTRSTLMEMAFEEANANPKPGAIAPLSTAR